MPALVSIATSGGLMPKRKRTAIYSNPISMVSPRLFFICLYPQIILPYSITPGHPICKANDGPGAAFCG